MCDMCVCVVVVVGKLLNLLRSFGGDVGSLLEGNHCKQHVLIAFILRRESACSQMTR